MRWPELPRLTPQGCPYEHPILRGPGGHPPLRGMTLGILFARCRIGLRIAADLCGAGTDTRVVSRSVVPRLPTRRFSRGLPCRCRWLLPALGPWVHTTPRRFPPRCYAYFRTRPIHPVQPSPLLGDDQMQPSYCFQGCHPYSPVSPHPLRARLALSRFRGAGPQGWSVGVSHVRKALPRAISVGVLRPRPIDLPARA